MNKICILLSVLVLAGCQQEIDEPVELPPPVMHCVNLYDIQLEAGQQSRIDMDGDGTTDFAFSTLLVGDPILQRDRLQYYVYSSVNSSLLNNDGDESPMLQQGDWIRATHSGYQWFPISAIVLTEKITPLRTQPFWQGIWTNARHNYLPVQVLKNGHRYHGWIELSFKKEKGRLVLHRTAISTEAERPVKAGD